MNDLRLSYYPGCTLSSTAKEIDEALQQVCNILDIRLETLPDWNCCGSSSVHAIRPQLAVSLAARNLFQAQAIGADLMVMCAGCSNRLRVASHQLQKDEKTRQVNRTLLNDQLDKDLRVNHLLDLLPERLKKSPWKGAVSRPLNGLRYASYYGCLLATPPEVKDYPKLVGSMEEILSRAGAKESPWGHQAKCCGAFLSVVRPEIAEALVSDIMENAFAAGAECIVTACAMCQLNLELRSEPAKRLPVFSIVELLAYCLGSDDWPHWFGKHLIDPIPLFENRVLNSKNRG